MDSSKSSMSRIGRIFKWAFIAIGVGWVILIGLAVIDMIKGPQVFEHAAASEVPFNVPADATDICGITRPAFYPVLAYEFTCSEKSFIAWAKENDFKLREIKGGICIIRYLEIRDKGKKEFHAESKNGLFYNRIDSPDSGISLAYDRESGRAYFYATTR